MSDFGLTALGAAFISGAFSLAGSLAQASAIKQAASLSTEVQREGIRVEEQALQRSFEQQQLATQQLQPFVEFGRAQLPALSEALQSRLQSAAEEQSIAGIGPPLEAPTFNPADPTQTPEFDFRLEQVKRVLERGQAARGQFLGGAALEALANATNALTADELDRSLQRQSTVFQNQLASFEANVAARNQALAEQSTQFNQLAGLANIGLEAGRIQGQIAAGFGNTQARLSSNISQGLTNIGNTLGQGIAGAGQIRGQSLADIGTSLGNLPTTLAGSRLLESELKKRGIDTSLKGLLGVGSGK